jgi:4-aminobutyrate aminotransferase
MEPMNVPGPRGKAIMERHQGVISPSYARASPLVISHGKGSHIWDVDGNHFLDFASGIAVNSTGHSHPKVVNAIKEQADKFLHISADFYHDQWASLGEELDMIAPFKEDAMSFMTNSGTEAVEAAIKLARHHTGASQFVGFLGAFHGRTLGSLSFTASKPHYREGFFPMMGGVVHIPYPNPYRPILATRPGEDYGEVIVRYLETEIFGKILPHQEVAGILVEPIQGEGGYVVPTPGFFPALRDLCDKYDILLIADEVQSGMGRTGKWWAMEHFGVEPDIICIGKGIASGIPLGAITARKSKCTWGAGTHGNTFGGNPLACAAALATIDLIREEFMENAAKVGAYTLDALQEIQVRHPSIGDVRGRGLMIGVEFVMDRETKEAAHDLRDRVEKLAFERGLITLGCGSSVIRIAPPLSISKHEMDDGLEIFEEAITLAEKEFELINVA